MRPIKFSATALVATIALLTSANSIPLTNRLLSPAIASTKTKATKSNKSVLYPISISVKQGSEKIPKWGYIDRTGKVIVKPQFDRAGSMSDGFATVEIGGKGGIIDRMGKTIFLTKVQTVQQGINEGLIIVSVKDEKTGDKWGYANTSGKIVIPAKFKEAGIFGGGLAPVKSDDDKWGYINKSGDFVIQPQFQNAESFSESDNLANVKLNGKWGYIDRTGKMIIEPQFAMLSKFNKGLASAEIFTGYDKRNPVGYIDRTGKFIIPAQFQEAEEFNGDIAPVVIDGKYTLIDRTGKIITKNRFDEMGGYQEDLVMVGIDGKKGFIDRRGEIVVKPEYDTVTYFSEGLAAVSKDGKWGYVDRTGKLVIPLKLNSYGYFRDGIAAVDDGQPSAYIDTKGKFIWRSRD